MSHLKEKGLDVELREDDVQEYFKKVFEQLEANQLFLANAFELDHLDSFADKKKLTSAMRRLAPIGLATTIMQTSNLRGS